MKPPLLVSFDGNRDPLEHIIAINAQMAIIGVDDSLKCKLMDRKFNEPASYGT